MARPTKKIDKYELLNMIADEGCDHPVRAMARIALKAENDEDMLLAFNCYKELAQYLAPKLKSIEMVADPGTIAPITIIVPQTSQLAEHAEPLPTAEIKPGELETEEGTEEKPTNVVPLRANHIQSEDF